MISDPYNHNLEHRVFINSDIHSGNKNDLFTERPPVFKVQNAFGWPVAYLIAFIMLLRSFLVCFVFLKGMPAKMSLYLDGVVSKGYFKTLAH